MFYLKSNILLSVILTVETESRTERNFFSGDAVIIYWFAYNFPQATFQTI